jgi:flagellar biosynthesis/type III secretory pathway protein FliH
VVHRQQILFSRLPTGFGLRSVVHTSGKQPAFGLTEDEIRAAREETLTQQNKQVQNTLESLEFVVQEYEERRQQSLSELQLIAIELSIIAASRVVRSEIDRNSVDVEEFVAEAIDRLAILENAKIRLHPDDLQSLQKRLHNKSTPWNAGLITLVADATVERGGVRLETDSGRVVLSDVMTRMAEIHDEWTENIDDAQTEHRSTAGDGKSTRRFPDRRETA